MILRMTKKTVRRCEMRFRTSFMISLFTVIFLLLCSVVIDPVSYTHLDVYKRQVLRNY